MSQRSALLISLMLTAIVGVAIVANRDRLLQASPAPVVSGQTNTGVQDDLTSGQTPVANQTGTRVLEVTLPVSAESLSRTLPASDDDRFDDDRHDDDRFDDNDHDSDDLDDDDHDDDHDDDDRYDDDHEDDDDH